MGEVTSLRLFRTSWRMMYPPRATRWLLITMDLQRDRMSLVMRTVWVLMETGCGTRHLRGKGIFQVTDHCAHLLKGNATLLFLPRMMGWTLSWGLTILMPVR